MQQCSYSLSLSLSLSLSALHSHNSEPLPAPAQIIGLVPRVAMPMEAVDSVKLDVERQLKAEAAKNHDDNDNFRLEDLPNEGKH